VSAVQQAYDALCADAALLSMVDGRIYPGRLPQSEPNSIAALFPCIVYRQVSLGDAPVSHDGLAGWERPRVQIDCWAEPDGEDSAYALAHAVADAVKTAVRAASFTVESENDLPDPETSLHRVIIDALFWTTSTD